SLTNNANDADYNSTLLANANLSTNLGGLYGNHVVATNLGGIADDTFMFTLTSAATIDITGSLGFTGFFKSGESSVTFELMQGSTTLYYSALSSASSQSLSFSALLGPGTYKVVGGATAGPAWTDNSNGVFNYLGNDQASLNYDLRFGRDAATPEPFTMSLGLAGVGVFLRRRMKTKKT
ncbi:MAG: hypothetical protein ACHQ50_09405, partial [Fimbriimonadales bacterium]